MNGSRIVISLVRRENHLELSVADDGSGLDAPYRTGAGSGLQIMRYRANAIGGTLTFAPPVESGCQVLCTVPMTGQEDEDEGRCPIV